MPKLANLTQKIGSGATPKGGKNAYKGGEFSLIRSQNVLDFSFSFDGLVKINAEQAKALSNVEVFEGDVLLNITGDSVARCCQVDPDCLPARVNQHVCIIRPKPNVLDAKFLKYVFLEPLQKQHLLMLSSAGATRSALTKGMIEDLEIPDFPITEQKAIAHILGALDDKIELNQKMNQTLEDIAKAIFKSWFVDFDPVRAKVEGRPTGLPDEISDLFPDTFENSEIGEIPAGWEVVPAESLFDISIGRTPPRKEPEWFTENGHDVPWVSIKDMGDAGTFIGSTSEYLTNAAVKKHRIALLPAGSVIVSFKLTVGRVSILAVDATTNEAIAHFPKNACFPFQAFAYFYLKSFNYDALGSTSSIATAVNSKMIKAMPFLKANELILEKFEALVAPILARIEIATAECRTLSELRDTLLPKLISGELRIPDAEKFLEEAGI